MILKKKLQWPICGRVEEILTIDAKKNENLNHYSFLLCIPVMWITHRLISLQEQFSILLQVYHPLDSGAMGSVGYEWRCFKERDHTERWNMLDCLLKPQASKYHTLTLSNKLGHTVKNKIKIELYWSLQGEISLSSRTERRHNKG